MGKPSCHHFWCTQTLSFFLLILGGAPAPGAPPLPTPLYKGTTQVCKTTQRQSIQFPMWKGVQDVEPTAVSCSTNGTIWGFSVTRINAEQRLSHRSAYGQLVSVYMQHRYSVKWLALIVLLESLYTSQFRNRSVCISCWNFH